MILATTEIGRGQPLLILHGLFGSGDNWRSIARSLSERCRVVLVDLRNHGSSGHSATMSYADMAGDIAETLDSLQIEAAHLVGHSMGGKAAMRFALEHQERVRSLVVVDIVPKPYPPHHASVLRALGALQESAPGSRQDADAVLARSIESPQVRAFLLKSVAPDAAGVYRWTLNASAIRAAYQDIAGWPELDAVFDGPTLFVRGEASDYIASGDLRYAQRWFPAAVQRDIKGAGHWVHADRRDEFCDALAGFLDGVAEKA